MALGARYRRWSLRILWLVMCSFLFASATTVSAQSALPDLYDDGIGFLNQGSYQAAIENLRRVVEADPAFTGQQGSAARHLAMAMAGDGEEGGQLVRIRGIEALLANDTIDGRLVHDAVLALDASEPVPEVISRAYQACWADKTLTSGLCMPRSRYC
jgi:hypothetical protein